MKTTSAARQPTTMSERGDQAADIELMGRLGVSHAWITVRYGLFRGLTGHVLEDLCALTQLTTVPARALALPVLCDDGVNPRAREPTVDTHVHTAGRNRICEPQVSVY